MDKDLNYQLGEYVGEYITSHYLPALSTDSFRTNNVKHVSGEDTRTHNELAEVYSKSNTLAAFEEYRKFNQTLAKKYLPEKLVCLVPKISPTNMSEFYEGLKDQLWGTDLSYYFPEDDFYKEAEEWAWCCTITLTLKNDN